MQRIWVSGYRAFELAVFDPKDPKKTVIERVLKEFLTQWLNQNEEESWLITGPQLGVEQWSAEAGLSLKEDYPRLKVAMMLPFADFANRWNEANQAQLASLKANVDFSAEVSPQPYQSLGLRSRPGKQPGPKEQALLVIPCGQALPRGLSRLPSRLN